MGFRALWISENQDGSFSRNIIERNIDELPENEVLIKVLFSSLNYKDALSATGNKGITRKFPHTPGIDAAGIVVSSIHPDYKEGDEVVVTGHDLGMNTPGGYGEYIRVPASWIIPKPRSYDLKESMIIGTAGFTAATALYKMERLHINPSSGPIVVTGSTGGVGSLAVSILSSSGYEVIAITGKTNAEEYLQNLGAKQIEPRAFVDDQSGKALLRPQWAGAIDTVGGNTLNTLLKACSNEGCVASTGLVSSPRLDTTVYPFILNGVSLLGIGSAETPGKIRKEIWSLLDTNWNVQPKLASIATEVSLEELNEVYFDKILAGKTRGRIIIRHEH
ncbi:MAG: YhdH/YhfP family quinone oxidoreductase [Flavitalea sp.]